MQVVFSKTGQPFILRQFEVGDAESLGHFLETLSPPTKSRFGPHPLTRSYIHDVSQNLEQDRQRVSRYVLQDRRDSIVGYVILEHQCAPEEIARYAEVGVDIRTGSHFRFAPLIHDDLQNSGIASQVLKRLIVIAREKSIDSIVLMGGTQSTNALAVAFYKKFGFKHVTSYWTDIENFDMQLSREDFPTNDDIVYAVDRAISPEAFVDLLKRSTLAERRPVENLQCIEGMLRHQSLLLSAWQGEQLIGVARSVTDFHYACYLSDLAVDAKFQRRGIGKALILGSKCMLADTCKLILIAAPAANTYYEPLGFVHNDRCWVMD